MTSVAVTGSDEALKGRDLAPWLFAVAVFTSAALVFLVEPLIGKLFLPVLGGSPAIWNTTLAFFQAALLAGYGYAHVLQKLGTVRRQMVVHLAAMALAALVLPLEVSQALGEPWTAAPAFWLAATLALSLGPPFAILSATAPLLQAWYARLQPQSQGGRDAYTLYAASNLGSLIALAAYPMLVEPLMGLSLQARLWSVAYGCFAALIAALAWRIWRRPEVVQAQAAAMAAPPSWKQRLVWVGLAAAPSSLLVGVTAHLTADVASVPFLWVVPLELYLATFVIAFRGGRAPAGPILLTLQILGVAAALMLIGEPNVPWPQQLAVHLAAFFVTTLVCHKALASQRPEPSRLTDFYLCMSLGGVLGGGFNALLAPVLFDAVYEYAGVLVLSLLARPWKRGRLSPGEIAFFVMGVIWIAPLWLPQIVLPGMFRGALMLAPVVVALLVRDRAWAVAILLGGVAVAGEVQGFGRYRESHRSFFGVVHITEVQTKELGAMRIMVHGTTLHGAQAQAAASRCRPTAYYASGTVIGEVFRIERAQKPSLRMGVVGLGTGAVSTFVRLSDSMRFFEIDPLVSRITLDPSKFSFVRGCAKGPVDVVLGDARLSIAKEPKRSYDLLLVDAFSSDAVPTHLLTVEAVRSYLDLLAPDGVLLLHLSNRNLELVKPAAAAAKAAGAAALAGEHWVEPSVSPYVETGGMVLLAARNPASLERYLDSAQWRPPPAGGRAWTDDYTNVWGAMIDRFRGL